MDIQGSYEPVSPTSDIGGLTATAAPGGGVVLYYTSDPAVGSNAPATVDEFTDSAPFNATISPSSTTVLYTAPANGIQFDGISFVPTVPEPISLTLISIAPLFLLRRRNRLNQF